jgi:hypothetical protein
MHSLAQDAVDDQRAYCQSRFHRRWESESVLVQDDYPRFFWFLILNGWWLLWLVVI